MKSDKWKERHLVTKLCIKLNYFFLLSIEYYEQMQNDTYNEKHNITCYEMIENTPPELEAFASCLNSEAKFNYTIAFLLLPLAFYLTEFLMLRPEYEPTGLRQRIIVSFPKNNKNTVNSSLEVDV